MKRLILLCLAFSSCTSSTQSPLEGYFIEMGSGVTPVIGIWKEHNPSYKFSNWLSVTSDTTPRVITSYLKAPRTNCIAVGQLWVASNAIFVNTPEIVLHAGRTNSGYRFESYWRTNDWPEVSAYTELIYVRSIEMTTNGLADYAKCRVRVWTSATVFAESEAILLVSCLTNRATLIK